MGSEFESVINGKGIKEMRFPMHTTGSDTWQNCLQNNTIPSILFSLLPFPYDMAVKDDCPKCAVFVTLPYPTRSSHIGWDHLFQLMISH